ncbi:MAG TPA: hypothetical protein VFM51_08620 [Solirubrobacterales bacterium]|nr:hypothetical protein [Solirubrobacterales bacterium]
MTDGSKEAEGRGRPRKRLRLVAPIGALATGTAIGAGIIIALYPATNKDLAGLRLLLAIALGAAGVFLLVEGVNRIRESESWKLACVTGAGLAIVSLVIAVLPASDHKATVPSGGLRISMTPVEPEFFTVAFQEEIGQPAADEGWRELHRRGGIDIGDSRFRLILANKGSRPISVLRVHPVVLDSGPPPGGTLAWHPPQGEEAVGKMTALIASDRTGSTGQVFKGVVNPNRPDLSTPYFQSTYIALSPGEVYPLDLTVLATSQRSIRYQLVAEGKSADRRFVAKSPAYTIVGGDEDPYQTRFARYYRLGVFANECTPTPNSPWVNGSYTARSKACPDGLGTSYPVQPPSATDYPPGELELSLGLTPGGQSVEISGVRIGEAPAATPLNGVVPGLLRALGTWDSCMVRAPGDGYWSARWDRWYLELTFAASGAGDCTPTSRSSLHRISIFESGIPIETDRGRFLLGSGVTSLPSAVQEILGAVNGGPERLLYVRGTEACPTASQPDLADPTDPVGIAVLSEDLHSTAITGLETYLPASDC